MDEIKNLIKGEVDNSHATRQAYSHDASIFEVVPEAVVYPKSNYDLSELVHYASRLKLGGNQVSLTARNGGTCMSGGSLTESLILDMSKHFNHVGACDIAGRSIWVQGGAMHINVEKATHKHKLYFAPYTSSRDICGIGGMLGNNASGERSVKYGPVSSNVLELNVLLSDGEVYNFKPLTPKQLHKKMHQADMEGRIYRDVVELIDDNWHLIQNSHPKVKKNAAGYALWDLWDKHRGMFDLGRLFIGAQGTLGIITEAKLKLVPFSKAETMVTVTIDNLNKLTTAVKALLAFNPEVCETFDHFTYDLAKQFLPEDAKLANFAEGKHMVLFAIYSGDTQTLADNQAQKAHNRLKRLGYESQVVIDRKVAESMLVIRRKSFKMLLDNPHPDFRALAFLEDTIVPLEHYGEFLASLEKILSDYNMTYTYAGHIGDGSIRLVPLANVELPDAPDNIMELSRRVYDLVFAFGGSMSVDHNDGIIRTPFIERMYGKEMSDLFEKIKTIFDPLNIFNPGKKVGGNLTYTSDHIIRRNT